MRTLPVVGWVTAVLLLTAGCSDDPVAESERPAPTSSAPAPTSTPSPSTTPTTTPSTTEPPARPPAFDADRAMRTVRDLAVGIGPRLATGPAFREAATYVSDAFASEGYAVRIDRFPVPGGDSWGVPVRAGRSANVVAEPPDFDPAAPYVIVGAHLDTIAVAPGAEDNASGVSVLVELARVLAAEGQVVLVAFGGEEPVGDGDLHHFGSKHHVAQLSRQERRSLRAMVSLDRVGVGGSVPTWSFPDTPTRVRDELVATARRLGIPTTVGLNTTSDHESFAVAGLPAARIGSTDYEEYHSAADLPHVVQPAQLGRVGRLLTAWLRASWIPRTR